MALLADDDFGDAVHLVHQVLPFLMFAGVGAGFFPREIIFLAVDEEHHVGVLLDGAGFAQVGQLRAFVVTVFNLAGKLREGHDGDGQFLGQRLEAHGNFRHLLHAAFGGLAGGTAEELQVIHHDKAKAALALQTPGARCELGDGEAAGCIDVKWQRLQFLADFDDAVEFIFGDLAAPDTLG